MEYLKIGERQKVGGKIQYKPERYDDGVEFGNIYKDEEVYEKEWDVTCYIPENAFKNEEEDGFFSKVDGYSHNDLLRLCNGNRELCDHLFNKLCWAYPETYLSVQNDWYGTEEGDSESSVDVVCKCNGMV